MIDDGVVGTIYLVHFERPYKHARHYTGFTLGKDVEKRLKRHRSGKGARLLAVAVKAGIDFALARTWMGTRKLERRLKDQGHIGRYCPICTPNRRRYTLKLKGEH